MRVAVIGGGAMGSLFSSMLSVSLGKENILLITKWKENINEIRRQNGIFIESIPNKTTNIWKDLAQLKCNFDIVKVLLYCTYTYNHINIIKYYSFIKFYHSK